MEDTVLLNNYSDWRYCIEEKCQISLTKDFITLRINELEDAKDSKTILFKAKYGEEYTATIISHYYTALKELK